MSLVNRIVTPPKKSLIEKVSWAPRLWPTLTAWNQLHGVEWGYNPVSSNFYDPKISKTSQTLEGTSFLGFERPFQNRYIERTCRDEMVAWRFGEIFGWKKRKYQGIPSTLTVFGGDWDRMSTSWSSFTCHFRLCNFLESRLWSQGIDVKIPRLEEVPVSVSSIEGTTGSIRNEADSCDPQTVGVGIVLLWSTNRCCGVWSRIWLAFGCLQKSAKTTHLSS